MNKNILGIILAIIFASLALLHVYWASRGQLSGGIAIPTVDGKPAFTPSPLSSLVVAALLFAAMATVLGVAGFLGDVVPKRWFRWAAYLLSLVFLLRAIGDFRLVGFFKQVRDTQFAMWDYWAFSPLCVAIAIGAFLLARE